MVGGRQEDCLCKRSERVTFLNCRAAEIRARPVGLAFFIGGRVRQYAAALCEGTPASAPVLHFAGLLTFGLLPDVELVHGDKPAEFRCALGTPGLGPETFASIHYTDVPEG